MTAMISDSSPEGLRKVRPPVKSVGEKVIVGREAEQKILRDLLRRAQRGLGGVVLVEGEPGMGKSLLLHEAAQEAAGQGFSLAAGASDQLGRAIPFFAFRVARARTRGSWSWSFTGDWSRGPAATDTA